MKKRNRRHRFIDHEGNPVNWQGKHEELHNMIYAGVDVFAYNAGQFHNGPKCYDCGESKCHHCHPEFDTEECPRWNKRQPPVSTT